MCGICCEIRGAELAECSHDHSGQTLTINRSPCSWCCLKGEKHILGHIRFPSSLHIAWMWMLQLHTGPKQSSQVSFKWLETHPDQPELQRMHLSMGIWRHRLEDGSRHSQRNLPNVECPRIARCDPQNDVRIKKQHVPQPCAVALANPCQVHPSVR